MDTNEIQGKIIVPYHSPLGTLSIIADDEGLRALLLPGEMENLPKGDSGGSGSKAEAKIKPISQSVIDATKEQLTQYFKGERKVFDLPLAPKGTELQKKVWAALLEIPYGETRSYGDIAEAVGNPKGARAVGMANNRNPIAIIIPCHRVIGKDGSMVGYGGGIPAKEKLLELEKTELYRGRKDRCLP